MSKLREDEGFTLLELIMAIVIMGIITLPLGNFILQYFTNFQQTQTRFSDSHDVQIATAYFGQDVSNIGFRNGTTTLQQSIWVVNGSVPFPAAPYCGSASGTPLTLMKWDDWAYNSTTNTATSTSHSAAYVYVTSTKTLNRVYCDSGATVSASSVLAHNIVYPDSANASPVFCTDAAGANTPCDAATPPPIVKLKLSIQGKTDPAIDRSTILTGQRRQT